MAMKVALGHFGSLGYYLSAWVAKYVGKAEESTEDIEIPEKWGFLRDSTLSTALTMIVFYLIAAIAAGSEFRSNSIRFYESLLICYYERYELCR